jgi:hypothetical protein
VIWTFERGAEIVRVETRVDQSTGEYVLVSIWADGRTETQNFQDHAEFDVRVRILEAQLAADNWSLAGSPTIVPDGWRGPTTH